MAKDLGKVCMVYKGDYASDVEYEKLDVVLYEGGTYCSLKDGNSDKPTVSGSWFKAAMGAYALAVSAGYSGTESDFITALAAISGEVERVAKAEKAAESAKSSAANAQVYMESIKSEIDSLPAGSETSTMDAKVIKNVADIAALELKTENITKSSTIDDESIVIETNEGDEVVNIDQDGVAITGILKINGHEVMEKNETSSPVMDEEVVFGSDDDNDDFAKIGNYGIKAKGYYDLEGNVIGSGSLIKGKKVYSLCDSLGEIRDDVCFQQAFADATGSTFVYGSGRELVAGGRRTLDDSGECAMDRARTLVSKYSDVDVLLIQNINDYACLSNAGSKTDKSFMLEQSVVSSNVYSGWASVVAGLSYERSLVTPKIGTMIRMAYSTTNSFKITVSNAATASGEIQFTVNGSTIVSPSSISSGETTAEVCAKILSAEWTQHGLTATASGTDSVIISGTSNFTLICSSNNTGAKVSVASTASTSYYGFCFTGDDVSEWNDSSKWTYFNNITLWSVYKGLIEYLQRNLPKAQIFFCILPRLTRTSTDEGKDAWDAAEKAEELYDVQIEVSKYMWIDYADVARKGGINYYNMLSYYPTNNVHPTGLGNQKIGEQIARLLF